MNYLDIWSYHYDRIDPLTIYPARVQSALYYDHFGDEFQPSLKIQCQRKYVFSLRLPLL